MKSTHRIYKIRLDDARIVVVEAPIAVTPKEMERIQKWIALQLLVTP